jgi:hypothetical protein
MRMVLGPTDNLHGELDICKSKAGKIIWCLSFGSLLFYKAPADSMLFSFSPARAGGHKTAISVQLGSVIKADYENIYSLLQIASGPH